MRALPLALSLLLAAPALAQQVQVRLDPRCTDRLDVARVVMEPGEGGVTAWLVMVAGVGALRGEVRTPEVPGMEGRQAAQPFETTQNGSGRVALGRFGAMPGAEAAAALAGTQVSCG